MRRLYLLLPLICVSCSSIDPGELFSSPSAAQDQAPVPGPRDVATGCGGDCDARVPTACTCDAADPCGWAGDGTCDAPCLELVPDGLDDSADCAAGGSIEPAPAPAEPCGGQCGALERTACTCAADDPCGWADNGVCDGDCFYVMPGATFDDRADCFGKGEGGTSGSGLAGTCSLVVPGATGHEPGGEIPVCCAPTDVDRGAIDEAFALLNEHRLSRGRPPLAYDPALESAIQGHCMHMALHDFFSHDAPEYVVSSPWDRASMCDADAHGENIAWGYESPQDVMTGWKWSPGHNANMLNASFARVGIGKYGTYWGQLFGM